jgi:hypothetical protein
MPIIHHHSAFIDQFHSTTQTVVGALAGAGIAAGTPLKWGWATGSLSQIAASWVISPLISAAVAAALFMTLKYAVLERKEPLKWGMRMIPWYLSFTAIILTIFMIDELPGSEHLDEMAPAKAFGILFGTSATILALAYGFLVPYFHRKLIMNDARMRVWHIPLGPLLYKENPPIYFPGKGTATVTDYYAKSTVENTPNDLEKSAKSGEAEKPYVLETTDDSEGRSTAVDRPGLYIPNQRNTVDAPAPTRHIEPEERWLKPVEELSWVHPKKLGNWAKFILLQGVSRDVVTQESKWC